MKYGVTVHFKDKIISVFLSLFYVFDVKDVQYAGKLFITLFTGLLCSLYCKKDVFPNHPKSVAVE